MAFRDNRLPQFWSEDARVGPGFKTDIIRTLSGNEQRISNWSAALVKFDIGHRVRTLDEYANLLDFFYVMNGMAHTFPVKDHTDYKSSQSMNDALTPTDVTLGTGDASETVFTIKKTYTLGANTYNRTNILPVSATVRPAIDGTEQMSGFTVQRSAGTVTFSSPPGNGLSVTAGFEFDVPCRFDTDDMEGIWRAISVRAWPDIPLVEVRGPHS